MSINQNARHNWDIFLIFFNMKVCFVFLLESPPCGDSNYYTQYTIVNRKSPLIIPNLQLWDFFLGTQEQVRYSHGT